MCIQSPVEPELTRFNVSVLHGSDVDPRIVKAIEFMWVNIREQLRISDIARAVYMSEDHFKHAFTQNTGAPPKRVLKSMRLGLARILLLTSDRLVKQIAADCGIPEVTVFVRE